MLRKAKRKTGVARGGSLDRRPTPIRPHRLSFEPLEPRLVLGAGPLVISEFMADNDAVLADVDDDYRDWIEIHNPTDAAVDLDGWYLTDEDDDLSMWEFPSVTLGAGGYLVVFASDKDRTDPAGELHTNFKLSSSGEYLALVQPDGTTIASEFAPRYPDQDEDVSYGLSQDVTTLVAAEAEATLHVPTQSDAPTALDWTATAFDDSTWIGGDPSSAVLITEVGTGQLDWFEIENVAGYTVDTDGWFVAVNFAQFEQIGDVSPTVWDLPEMMAGGEVLYRTESEDDNYFGEGGIFWRTSHPFGGWVMLVDDQGQVADFVVWGHTEEEVNSLEVTVNGVTVIAGGAWNGEPVTSAGLETNSLRRIGTSDNNSADDFAFLPSPTKGLQNVELGTPFLGTAGPSPRTGLGFNADSTGFDVTRYQANLTVYDVAGAERVIADPSMQLSVTRETAGVIDYFDSGADGHFAINHPFPGVPSGSGIDNFVIEATATIMIPEPGQWTFGVSSNDGFSLELADGASTFSSSYPGLRGTDDTLSVFDVARGGTYDLRLVAFDRTGGASVELFAARGTHTEFREGVFDLVGDVAAGGLAVSGFGGVLHTDIASLMHDVSTSLWMRIPFEVADPAQFDVLTLRVKYNDGFVAYLNGREIARRNAPALPQWDSHALATRSIDQSLVFERIPVSSYLDSLQPGTNVLAIHGLSAGAEDDDFLILPELTGSRSLGTEARYLAAPTPAAENTTGTLVADGVEFSVGRGFYDEPFQVAITPITLGATIRYTIDGSAPTETNGRAYRGPIAVGTTTTLRAAAFKPGYQPGTIGTHTYIFLDDVLRQPNNPPGFPGVWQPGYVADYEMDPQVVNNPLYAGSIKDDLMSIPSMSIVMDIEDVFGQPNGIYSNSNRTGPAWERGMSLEYFDPADPDRQFQVDSAVRMHGKGSRFPNRTRKHNFRAIFKEPFGPTKLEFPLFEGSPIERFDTLVFRAGYNYSWNHNSATQRTRAQYLRDTFTRETHREMGQPTVYGDYVHLYINGLYWGVYLIQERPDTSFQALHLGGDKTEYDALNGNKVIDGDRTAYNELMKRAGEDLAVAENYQAVLELLDPVSLVDYMILQLYSGTTDWPVSEGQLTNWWMGRKRVAGDEGRFKFYTWDAEHTQYSVSANRFGASDFGTPPYLFTRLRANADFRNLVGDRLHLHMFNDGALTVEANVARYQEWADKIQQALVGESARWADQKSAQANRPHTVRNEWMTERNWMLGTYFPQRHNVVVQQFRNYGLYPSRAAAVFQVNGRYRHGGVLEPGEVLTANVSSGTVYYTLDGSDPRMPDGSVNPAALPTTSGSPISLPESSLIRTRVRSGSQWSALNEAHFLVNAPPAAGNLAITEIHYHPADPTDAELAIDSDWTAADFEFIELANMGQQPIDLFGVQLTEGVRFEFTTHTSSVFRATFDSDAQGFLYSDDTFGGTNSPALSSGQYDTMNGSDGGGLHLRLGLAGVAALASGGFSRTFQLAQADTVDVSLQVRLIMEEGYESDEYVDVILEIDGVRYGADSNGSLMRRAGDGSGGGPEDSGWREVNVEARLTAGPHTLTVGAYQDLDTPGDKSAEVFLDEIAVTRSPDLWTLAPGERVVVVDNPQAFSIRYNTAEILLAGRFTDRLANGGERIRLADANGDTLIDFRYDDDGNWPGGDPGDTADGKGAALELIEPTAVPLLEPERTEFLEDGDNWHSSVAYGGTPGADSEPPLGIVVNEVLTHTDAPLVDAIELHNTTDVAVDLGGWYLSDSWGWDPSGEAGNYRKFRIPDGTLIPADGYLVFDEADFNPGGGTGATDFALSGARGDDVWLMKADTAGTLTHFADHVEFAAAAASETWGRWATEAGKVSFYPMVSPTIQTDLPQDGANSGPRVGPVIISELHYNPGPGEENKDLEFIEIYNGGLESVDLIDWRIRKGIDFDFPAMTLAPHSQLIVVPFDPDDLEKRTAFQDVYWADGDVPADLVMLGPYAGRLADNGERVRLQRPDEAPLGEPDFVPRLLEDEVAYDDGLPWPGEADGTGRSLTRQGAGLWGNDPVHWAAADPSPGAVDFLSDYVHPGDANLDDVTDVRDFMIWNTHKFTSGTDWSTGDFNSDGVTDVRDFMIWNVHKFTSAPAPVSPNVAGQEFDDAPEAVDALAWLGELEWSHPKRSSDAATLAAEAVDRLLATYWD